ncbi:hypothetical protein [Saccharopolyspora sp. ASAGF58]|uniref:hypothetical protein n=1 Tax=Saccharopolyspora sp. ASAGF58 TaxID=2719023 RepID=UPI0014453E67|nr:hypothetical protein [Saccharopolyspora sp. ASAGF58]
MKRRVNASIYRRTAGRAAIARWCTVQLDSWPVAHQRRTISIHGEPAHPQHLAELVERS